MTKLSSDDKDQLLIRLLSQGRGSLDFARNMLTGSDDIDPPSPQPEQNIPETWCTCGVWRKMPDEQENVCCKKRTCVTSYVMFNTVCLDREVLQLVIRARCDITLLKVTGRPLTGNTHCGNLVNLVEGIEKYCLLV